MASDPITLAAQRPPELGAGRLQLQLWRRFLPVLAVQANDRSPLPPRWLGIDAEPALGDDRLLRLRLSSMPRAVAAILLTPVSGPDEQRRLGAALAADAKPGSEVLLDLAVIDRVVSLPLEVLAFRAGDRLERFGAHLALATHWILTLARPARLL